MSNLNSFAVKQLLLKKLYNLVFKQTIPDRLYNESLYTSGNFEIFVFNYVVCFFACNFLHSKIFKKNKIHSLLELVAQSEYTKFKIYSLVFI